MEKSIVVIIPVFNAFSSFTELVRTIEESYPIPDLGLRFIISDDASTDPAVRQFFRSHSFFKRKDVKLILNRKNLGFTKNINRAIKSTKSTEDIVLLNSDTKIFGRLFHSLQEQASSQPLVGSVTPLTNNGTIASIYQWPNGGSDFDYLDQNLIQTAIHELDFGKKLIEIPTAVGFCFFIPRTVFNEVGFFNEVDFLKGYGEENDWCMRANRLGYKHFLSLKNFVFHVSGQSFQKQKIKLLQSAIKKLSILFPDYFSRVKHHLEQDPWRAERFLILLSILKLSAKLKTQPLKVFVLHNDPEYHAGGVELHVKNQTMQVVSLDHKAIQVFLVGQFVKIRLIFSKEKKIEFSFSIVANEIVYLLWKTFSKDCYIHVHHLVGYPKVIRDLIQRLPNENKTLTLHDYWMICPSINMLSAKGVYCNLPKLKTCENCLKTVYKINNIEMKSYRNEFANLVNSFNHVITPSTDSKKIIEKGFLLAGAKVKLDVENNPLFFPQIEKRNITKKFNRKVIFLGAISAHKGAALISMAIPILKKLKIEPEIWGLIGAVNCKETFINIRYSSREDLISLKEKAHGAIVCLPFLWPETFSYTLYEALILLQVPVVVGPFGHPASLVHNNKLGVVMKEPNLHSLLVSLQECSKNYERFIGNTALFVKDQRKNVGSLNDK